MIHIILLILIVYSLVLQAYLTKYITKLSLLLPFLSLFYSFVLLIFLSIKIETVNFFFFLEEDPNSLLKQPINMQIFTSILIRYNLLTILYFSLHFLLKKRK
ncbi:hypothetical protein IGI37_001129 [Enterococcus sp. AZ194]